MLQKMLFSPGEFPPSRRKRNKGLGLKAKLLLYGPSPDRTQRFMTGSILPAYHTETLAGQAQRQGVDRASDQEFKD